VISPQSSFGDVGEFIQKLKSTKELHPSPLKE
jgi:hypothetical protein